MECGTFNQLGRKLVGYQVEHMKISIITVVFNAVKTIEQAILSVLNQSYKELEYIIIDGGSTDGTLDIIRKYEKKISYWVSEPDEGIYNAMNKGIDIATGDVIAFLNSDDWYEKDTFKCVSENFKDDIDILAGRVAVYRNGEILEDKKVFSSSEEIMIRMIYPHPGIFARRKLFDKFGRFDESYKISADYDWLLRIYIQDIPIKYIDKVLVNFRAGGASSAKETLNESLKISLDALLKMKEKGKIDKLKYEETKNKIVHYRKNAIDIFELKKALEKQLLKEIDINEEVKNVLDYDKKYSVFGCGVVGKECFELLEQIGISPTCFWDNDKTKWGTTLNGIVIKRPQEICRGDSIVIIASTYYEDEITLQLYNMGMKEYIDFICYSEIRNKVGKAIKKYF